MIRCLLLFGVLAWSRLSWAATYTAATCAESDVQTAIGMATNGDTVNIPACSQTNWTTTLNVNVGITLQGAGQGSTTIGDNVPKGDTSCQGGGPIIQWTVNSPNSMRMTAMTIVAVATDPNVCSKGHIKVSGTTHSMRVDHITITAITSSIFISGDVWGLVDHYTFTGNFVTGVRVEHYGWNLFSSWNDLWGDASWSAPIHYGSAEGLYVEDSSFTGTSNVASAAATDCYSGGRFVFRHNTVSTLDIGSHGTDSDQRHRSCRWMEVYNNTFTYTTINQLGFIAWIRGGSGVFYNNTITATGYSNNIVQVANCRDPGTGCAGNTTGNFPPWGACNGTSPYDQNASGGYRCVDQPGAGTSNQLGPDTGGTITPANTWVGNISEPIYVWNNTLNGTANNLTGGTTNVVVNRDYYSGTARPSYTAYTYPHPLQGAVCSITPTSLGPWTNTQAVSQTLTASGCTSSTWTLTGAWPPGISGCNTGTAATCTVSGTVAGTGTFTPTVAYGTASNPYSITVNAAPSITTTTLPGGTVGTSYSQTLATSGGTAPLVCSVSSGALPAGLALSSACQITGAPTSAGTSSFTAMVADANGVAATQSLSIIVGSASISGLKVEGGACGRCRF